MSSSLFDSPSAKPESEPEVVRTVEKEDSFELEDVFETDRSFDYHPVPILAPAALVMGICALFAFLNLVAGLLIALFGLVVAAVCLLKIYRSGGVLGGKSFAWAGLALSLISFLGGPPTRYYMYVNEVPEGYQRVNFTEGISEKGFIVENGHVRPHPDILALDGEKIFLKGYMYPTRRKNNLSAFVFCRDNGQCCFGGKPKLQDMIVVKMSEEKTADFYNGLVAVAGTFHLRRNYEEHRFGRLTGTEPVFKMTATHVEPALTSF